MTKNHLINNSVIFYPDEHRLVKKDDPKVDLLLNIPASRCLALLIERKDCLITQKEFFEKVWESQGTYVTQNTFYQNISLLRKGLKAAGLAEDPIKTVLKRGMTLADTITIVAYEPPPLLPLSAEVQGAPTAPPVNATPVVVPAQRRIKWLYLLPIAVFCISSIGYFQTRPDGGDLFASYRPYSEVNGCKIMIPAKDKITDIYAAFLKSTPPSCPENGVAYLTTDRAISWVSIIQCNKDTHNVGRQCHSSAYMTD